MKKYPWDLPFFMRYEGRSLVVIWGHDKIGFISIKNNQKYFIPFNPFIAVLKCLMSAQCRDVIVTSWLNLPFAVSLCIN